MRDLRFTDVVELFGPGDVLVLNETKVIPARLLGRKPTGAPAEILLMRPAPGEQDTRVWEALVRPGSKLKPGRTVVVADDLAVEILDSAPGSGRRVRLVTELSVEEALERHGRMPLPPYLGREDEPLDRERYQTVYARESGSVAAPTAGLHFTPEILSELEARGVVRAALTLHVGIGTFRPVESESIDAHQMHHEWYSVPEAAAAEVNAARARGRRVWAVGTTAVRTLEAVADAGGGVKAGTGTTDLFIRPGYVFRVVDCLLTNFHLPRSTLLMLVTAFAGYERTMAAYAHAIALHYRFYSYGDAMAVVGKSFGRTTG
jgi:S-adenosylmethionine:tRNA ribosyltransferase-isomerase